MRPILFFPAGFRGNGERAAAVHRERDRETAKGRAMNLFIDSIQRGSPAPGKADDEQRLREARAAGREIRIDAGKRAEFRMPAGSRPVVHVIEGAVRFESDDTAALAGDSVCFRAVPEGEEGVIGIEADAAFVGVLVPQPPPGTPRAAA
jgi:hypothetical protein